MLCKIADLITRIPAAGGMSPRCEEYLIQDMNRIDIEIREDLYRPNIHPNLTWDQSIYLQSGFQFYYKLIDHQGMMLHASAIEMDGLAYLFSGPSGRGKSTHTRLWQQVFGARAQIFNDDKPALRCIEDQWYAYGTPWCGKDGINQNKKVPLAGICFLEQSDRNEIRRLDSKESLGLILGQTMRHITSQDRMIRLLSTTEKLIQEIPVFELKNKPVPEAARLSYETMYRSAKENSK